MAPQIWKLQIRKPTPQVKAWPRPPGPEPAFDGGCSRHPVSSWTSLQAVALDDMDIEEEAAEEVAAESDAAPPESEPAIEPEEAVDDEPRGGRVARRVGGHCREQLRPSWHLTK